MNWFFGLFGFIGKILGTVKKFLKSDYGVFLKGIAKTTLITIRLASMEKISKEEKKSMVVDKILKYCKGSNLASKTSWINFTIELIYSLDKYDLVDWLI